MLRDKQIDRNRWTVRKIQPRGCQIRYVVLKNNKTIDRFRRANEVWKAYPFLKAPQANKQKTTNPSNLGVCQNGRRS